MSGCVVWIDSSSAKLFKITATGVSRSELSNSGPQHSNSHQDAHKQHQLEHFFEDVAQSVGRVEELLIFGPGPAKDHFRNHLEKHHKHDLAHFIVGVESLDRLSDNQILEASRKFFKKYNQFHS